MLRKARCEEAEVLADLAMAAFSNCRAPSQRDDTLEEIQHNIAHHYVYEENGRIVAMAHVMPHPLRIGETVIVKGDVGEVAVLPECQGAGIGTRFLRDLHAEMQACGQFELARLGGYMKFYARFGYQRFLRRYMLIHVGGEERMGNSTMACSTYPLSAEEDAAVRLYQAAAHGAGVDALDQTYRPRYLGGNDRRSANMKESPLTFVYIENGEVAGVIRANESGVRRTEFQDEMSISYLEYDRSKPHVACALMRKVVNYTYEKGYSGISARVHFDPALIRALTDTDINFRLVETYGGISGNMLKIINLQSICEKMCAEWAARLKRSAADQYTGVVELRVAGQAAQLTVDQGQVSLTAGKAPDIVLPLDDYYFLNLLLGLASFAEYEATLDDAVIPSNIARCLLRDWFPRGTSATGAFG